jgi:hypothetical protein
MNSTSAAETITHATSAPEASIRESPFRHGRALGPLLAATYDRRVSGLFRASDVIVS